MVVRSGSSHRALAEVAARALVFLAGLPLAPTTLVVAHGGLLRSILGLVDGLPADDIGTHKLANATPVWRTLPAGRWADLLDGLRAGRIPRHRAFDGG